MRDAETSREANDLWFGAPEWPDREDEPPEPEPEVDTDDEEPL